MKEVDCVYCEVGSGSLDVVMAIFKLLVSVLVQATSCRPISAEGRVRSRVRFVL